MKVRHLVMGSNTGAMNMAIDEALIESELPVLRLYSWSPPAVTIGYFQKVEEEVDEKICRQLGVDIIRRQTGGGAVYHDKELTYSFITRKYPQNIMESYRWICQAVIAGLGTTGISAEFSPLNDITVGGKKISGCAQTRRNGVLLQHGTLLLGLDIEKMFSVLKVPNEKMRGKIMNDVKSRVTCLGLSFDDMAKAISHGFEIQMDAELFPDMPTNEELQKAKEICEQKYAAEGWLYRI